MRKISWGLARGFCENSRSRCGRVAVLALAFTSFFVEISAQGAGLYLFERGVRALGRGGAFVAGADDAGAAPYNPAGLVFAPNQVLADAGLLSMSTSFRRTTEVSQTDPNNGNLVSTGMRKEFPKVNGTSQRLPAPSAFLSHKVGQDLVLAAGVYAPYSPVVTYPEQLGDAPSPQRYSMLSTEGSLLSWAGFWGGWRANERISVGAGAEILFGSFASSVVLSSCLPQNFDCVPENPQWDIAVKAKAEHILAPTGIVGILYEYSPSFRLGASYHLPTLIDAPAHIEARLPGSPFFSDARFEEEDTRILFRLPWVARIGAEWRLDKTRVELSGSYEAWSLHKTIAFRSKKMNLRSVALMPDSFPVEVSGVKRSFQDSFSVRSGIEHSVLLKDLALILRAGLGYETSAVPLSHVSVLQLDVNKIPASLGFGVAWNDLRWDAVFAKIFAKQVVVSNHTAAQNQLNPLDEKQSVRGINAGTYNVNAYTVGMGMSWTFSNRSGFL